jgi:hypothetical protein
MKRRHRATALLLLLLLALTGAAHGSGHDAPGSVPLYAVGGIYVQPSADLLRRFGIISGDPGGNMRFGDTITRAEMAKVVVAAVGLSASARTASLFPPAFPDLEGHWARGWVALARLNGLTSGYQDGTFRPDAHVTYAEAITFLLRAAGVRPDGPWPAAYLQAARQHGVLDESLAAALPPGTHAQRGAVFLVAERAFTRIRDAQGRTVLQRAFAVPPPALVATLTVEGDQAVVTGTVTGAVAVLVDGRPALVTGGAFTVRAPLQPGATEVVVAAVGDTGAQTVVRLPIR